MTEEVGAVSLPLHERVRHGLRRPQNWAQFVRWVAVGTLGYLVNLGSFAALVHAGDVDYRIASAIAFVVTFGHNFVWHRHWTFRVRHVHAGFQAARFLVVALLAYATSFVVLTGLVELFGVAKVPAQALAIITGVPPSFLGQKLWSFRR